jgi:hypothetical protein
MYALVRLAPKMFQLRTNQLVIDLLVILPSPHPGASARFFISKCYEPGSVAQLLILPLFSPFGFVVESIKEFGGASLVALRIMIK